MLVAPLETLLNNLLRLDLESQTRVKALAGRLLALDVSDWQISLYFWPTAEGVIYLTRHANRTPDVRVQGRLMDLFSMSQRPAAGKKSASGVGQIHYTGSLELGEQLRFLLQNFDIDWEEQLSVLIGDVPAYHVGRVVRGLQKTVAQTMQSLRRNVSEYLLFESQIAVSRCEIEEFFSQLTNLRQDVDRAAAKLDQLKARLNRYEKGAA